MKLYLSLSQYYQKYFCEKNNLKNSSVFLKVQLCLSLIHRCCRGCKTVEFIYINNQYQIIDRLRASLEIKDYLLMSGLETFPALCKQLNNGIQCM